MSTGVRTKPSLGAWHWGWLLGLVLLLGLLSVQYYFKVEDDHRSAILRWRPQILQLADADIYKHFSYPNPPIMALLLRPLVELPPRAASLTWFYLKVGMTLVSLAWAFRLVEAHGLPFPSWAKVLAVVLSLRPIMGDLSHGNVNLFILFLVLASLCAFQQERNVTAGVLLGLSIACKVTPALFVPYFLWKRAWGMLAGCAVGLLLFLVVVPGLYLGMRRNLDLLQSWHACMVQPYVEDGVVTTEHPNQSLPGLLSRWFTHGPSFSDKGVPREYRNVAAVEPRTIQRLVKACMAAFAALIMWACRTPTRPRQNWRLAAEFSLVLLGMLLFSERTWKHHCVTLLLPFAVLAYCLAVLPGSRLWRGYLAGTLALVGLLMASTSTGVVGDWDRSAKLAQADGAYVWGYLLLTAALVALLRRRGVDLRPARVAASPPVVVSRSMDAA